MRQTVYTLVVDDFAPDIVALTLPLMARYAAKIGAAFEVIDRRRFPAMPVCYEKFQVRQLAEDRGDDWSLFLDADALVHPDLPDLSTLAPPHSVVFNAADHAAIRFRPDAWARRDGRYIAPGSWLVGGPASVWSDLWHPLGETVDVAVENIVPVNAERIADISREHLLDDYTLSRNVARFGLKVATVRALCAADARLAGSEFFWHAYTVTRAEKLEQIRDVLKRWGM